MEGNPSDLTVYIDTNITHDHTYYGNGCQNQMTTPCSTRIVKTADNEDQINGTYYHYQAVTSGSGGDLTTQNTNAPDTFCPLGWQLPYSGTGGAYYDKSKSWSYLLNTYAIEYDNGDSSSSIASRSYPLSYIFSGLFNWTNGMVYVFQTYGHYWTSTINSVAGAFRTALSGGGIQVEAADSKVFGFALRCV